MSEAEQAVVKIIGVRFRPVGKVYHFDATHFPTIKTGDYVIVETARGRQVGYVATLDAQGKSNSPEPLKPIERMATGRDLAMRRHWRNKEHEALEICRAAAARLGLPIKLAEAEYSFDGTRLVFIYTAEGKVDTTALRQAISPQFHARVELKLVGPRDVAKLLGGFGACGELQCCSAFLVDFGSISIKMAKEQDISLNPQETTGMCGRLRCCLAYEHEVYAEARKGLPKRGKEVGTPHGRGIVVELLPLQDAVVVQVGEQRFQVARASLLPISEREPSAPPAEQPQVESHWQRKRPPRAPTPPPAPPTEKEAPDRSSRRRRHRPSKSKGQSDTPPAKH
jgi:cell fate regulator YaaT (PSP1 superfamily)